MQAALPPCPGLWPGLFRVYRQWRTSVPVNGCLTRRCHPGIGYLSNKPATSLVPANGHPRFLQAGAFTPATGQVPSPALFSVPGFRIYRVVVPAMTTISGVFAAKPSQKRPFCQTMCALPCDLRDIGAHFPLPFPKTDTFDGFASARGKEPATNICNCPIFGPALSGTRLQDAPTPHRHPFAGPTSSRPWDRYSARPGFSEQTPNPRPFRGSETVCAIFFDYAHNKNGGRLAPASPPLSGFAAKPWP